MEQSGFKISALALAISSVCFSFGQAHAAVAKSVAQPHFERLEAFSQSEYEKHAVEAYLVVLKATSTTDLMARGNYSVNAARATYPSIEIAQQKIKARAVQLDPSTKILGSTKLLAPTVIISASETVLNELAKDLNVERVLPLRNYQLHISDVRDYIKATPVNAAGHTGQGQTVAVLDTGIDYTHQAFGGEATKAAYEAAQADPTSVAWPQGQVIGGYDYIRNDADPIENDENYTEGQSTSHGTSVAHSVTGIAPDVELYAYSVCGDNGCTFAAQIAALEAAMDPNGDGDIADRVDIINMSLGGEFGFSSSDMLDGTQFLIQQAVQLGTNVVVSAGNDGNHPFRIGGPSTTPNALSVGAMTHPAETAQVSSGHVNDHYELIGTASFGEQGEFSMTHLDAELIYPDSNQTGCVAFAEGVDFSGKGVIIDRGECSFSVKALNAQQRGAKFVIIANNQDGRAPGMSAGEGAESVTIRTISVSQLQGERLKAALADGVQPEYLFKYETTDFAGAVAGFSSRGPSVDGILKPEITAPGSNIMVAATGTQTELAPATGTSFSGPITAGAVAALREARPELDAFEVKATLMNTADLNVTIEPQTLNPNAALAPISLIGAGLVDLEKATATKVAAWVKDMDFNTQQAALSFGFQDLSDSVSLTKTVTVKNFDSIEKVYQLRIEERFANDKESGALSWDYPEQVTLGAGQTMSFDVTLRIDPAKLPAWGLTNPQSEADLEVRSDALTLAEFDGALVFDDLATEGNHDLHMVYHVLPKAKDSLTVGYQLNDGQAQLVVKNTGLNEVTLLKDRLIATGTEVSKAEKQFNILASTFNVFESSVCESGLYFTTSIKLRDALTHVRQAGFQVTLDVNNDGTPDFAMANYNDVGESAAVPGRASTVFGPIVDGQVSWQFLTAFFHSTGKDTVTFSACSNLIGFTQDNLGTEIGVTSIVGYDNYQLGISTLTDAVSGKVAFATAPASIVDAAGNAVTSLAPGAEAFVQTAEAFAITNADLSQVFATVDNALLAQPSAGVLPILNDLALEVDEHTESGTVLAQLSAKEQVGAAEISEFFVQSQNSEAIVVTPSGEVKVADAAMLDYDAGLHQVNLSVIAIDKKGRFSAPATIVINLNNKVDTVAEKTPMVSSEQVFTVNENAPIGTVVGQLSVLDQDNDLTEIKVSGTDAFSIDVSGQISVIGEVDFDAHARIKAQVIATDKLGHSSEPVSVMFDVKEDMSEGIPVIEAGQVFAVNEEMPRGTKVGQLSFSDADNDVMSFMVKGTDLISVTETGALLVAGNIVSEMGASLTFDVQALDARGNLSDSISVKVAINDVAKSSSSSSWGWLSLLALPLAIRRRFKS